MRVSFDNFALVCDCENRLWGRLVFSSSWNQTSVKSTLTAPLEMLHILV